MITFTEGGEEDLIITNIRRNWRILEEKGELPGQDDLIGILRTTLHSLSIWRSQSLDSQGYLRYIEGFMKKLGVSVRQATPDFQPLPEPPEDPLLLLGRTWITNEDEAVGAEFVDQVESLIRSGDAQRVMEVCQQLMGETQDLPVVVLIKQMALSAERVENRDGMTCSWPGPESQWPMLAPTRSGLNSGRSGLVARTDPAG